MFSKVSANSNKSETNSSWSDIFALAVDQYYDESQNKEQTSKKVEEECDYFHMDLSFDDETEIKVKEEKEISDTESTDNESAVSRTSSSLSLDCFYNYNRKTRFSSLLNENYMNAVKDVKVKALQVVNTQKMINTQRMMMASVLQKQALMKMAVAQNAAMAKTNEQTVSA